VKVTVEIDDEAIDLIVAKVLEDHLESPVDVIDLIVAKVLEDRIKDCYTDTFYHEEDIEWNNKLREALWIVFEYFAGEEKVKKLKDCIEGGEDEV